MDSVIDEQSIMVRSRLNFVYSNILNSKYIGANFIQCVIEMVESQEHTCNGNFLIENIKTDKMIITKKELTPLGVYLSVVCEADHIYPDIKDPVVIAFYIEDIKQGTILLRSKYFKYHLEVGKMSGYIIYKDDNKTSEVLVSNKDKKIYIGKKLYIKVKSYIICDKEDSFIVQDGEFIDTD